MPRKWDLPLELPPPSLGLNLALEVTDENDDPKPPMAEFLPRIINHSLRLGAHLHGALGIGANTVSEAGWHLKYRANNPFGWKITAERARDFEQRTGLPARWYRAAGNIDSKDPPTCFYMGFYSLEQGLEFWMRRHVPKPSETPPAPARGSDPVRYRATGAAFWAQRPWFPLLVTAGYKGPKTPETFEKTVRTHEALVREVSEWWAQDRLRTLLPKPEELTVDGAWGIRSAAACRAFQTKHSLKPTGSLDHATLEALLRAAPI